MPRVSVRTHSCGAWLSAAETQHASFVEGDADAFLHPVCALWVPQPNEATTTAASAPVPAPFPAPAPVQAAPKQQMEGNWDGDAGYRSTAPQRDPYGDSGGGGQAAKPKQKGEDEWGQEVLGDDLLPM